MPSRDPNAVKGKTAEDEAIGLLVKKGFAEIKRRVRGDPIGFDLKAKLNGCVVTIEVKGTESENEIPDSMGNEFDLTDLANPKLRADFLMIVRLRKDKSNQGTYSVLGAHLLPGDYVNGFKQTVKLSVVLSRELKNNLKNDREHWVSP